MAFALVTNAGRQAALKDTATFAHVAERFRRAGDLHRAVALCREGLKKFPTHVSARVTLGLALLDLAQYSQARAELQVALKRAPDNLAAIRGLAQLHDHPDDTSHLDDDDDLRAQNHWRSLGARMEAPSEPPAPERLAIEPVALFQPESPEVEFERLATGLRHSAQAPDSRPPQVHFGPLDLEVPAGEIFPVEREVEDDADDEDEDRGVALDDALFVAESDTPPAQQWATHPDLEAYEAALPLNISSPYTDPVTSEVEKMLVEPSVQFEFASVEPAASNPSSDVFAAALERLLNQVTLANVQARKPGGLDARGQMSV